MRACKPRGGKCSRLTMMPGCVFVGLCDERRTETREEEKEKGTKSLQRWLSRVDEAGEREEGGTRGFYSLVLRPRSKLYLRLQPATRTGTRAPRPGKRKIRRSPASGPVEGLRYLGVGCG